MAQHDWFKRETNCFLASMHTFLQLEHSAIKHANLEKLVVWHNGRRIYMYMYMGNDRFYMDGPNYHNYLRGTNGKYNKGNAPMTDNDNKIHKSFDPHVLMVGVLAPEVMRSSGLNSCEPFRPRLLHASKKKATFSYT
jgi:hypothetical protein